MLRIQKLLPIWLFAIFTWGNLHHATSSKIFNTRKPAESVSNWFIKSVSTALLVRPVKVPISIALLSCFRLTIFYARNYFDNQTVDYRCVSSFYFFTVEVGTLYIEIALACYFLFLFFGFYLICILSLVDSSPANCPDYLWGHMRFLIIQWFFLQPIEIIAPRSRACETCILCRREL